MSNYTNATGTAAVLYNIYFGNPARKYSDIQTGCVYTHFEAE